MARHQKARPRPMNARWLIAKYMSDVRRREPTNVGIVLITDRGERLARFKAEDESTGEIDGRKFRSGAVENYKAWVAHWKRALEKKADPRRLVTRDPTQNYFLEFGGERLLGNEEVDP